MNLATAIIVLLANHGYWVAGQEYPVNFAWAVRGGLPAATVDWVLLTGEVPLSHGTLALPSDAANGAKLIIRAPDVRVPTTLTLRHTATDAGDAQRQFDAGASAVHVFPPIDLTPFVPRLRDRELAVWDADDGLPRLLNAQDIPHTRIDGPSALLTSRAAIILVGPDVLQDEQPIALLRDLASRGAGVMIFRQSRIDRLGDYRLLARRGLPLKWRLEHPLLQDLPADAWQSLIQAEEIALAVPADHPALELAYWAPQVETRQPVPLDALLLTESIGDGRVIFCQLRTGDWMRDPRAQRLLRSSLDHLLTRPTPTPPPSQRTPAATQRTSEPNILSKDLP